MDPPNLSSMLRAARKTPQQEYRYSAPALRRENMRLRETAGVYEHCVDRLLVEGRSRIDALTRFSKCALVAVYTLCIVIVSLIVFR